MLRVHPFNCYSMNQGSSPASSAESLDLTLGPRIGAYCPMYRDVPCCESGCAVPWIGICFACGTLSHRTRYLMGSTISSRLQH